MTDEGEANPAGDSLARGGFKYRQGDRVMQIRNNYDKNVFNGDIGTVSAVDTEDRSLTERKEIKGTGRVICSRAAIMDP